MVSESKQEVLFSRHKQLRRKVEKCTIVGEYVKK